MPLKDCPPELVDQQSSSLSSSNSLENEVLSNRTASSLSNFTDDDQGLPQYRPIVFPKEPSLDELLRQVSGSNNLDTLTEVNLKIMSSMVCIQRLDVFLPNLVSLNLDGSSLNSLRDLGTNLTIKFLNVSRCGLTNLDGTNGLITLVHLVADSNQIVDVGPLYNLCDLQKLSLRGNKIKTIGTVSFLLMCSELRDLDLSDNPIVKIPNYRLQLRECLSNIMILDEVPFYDRKIDAQNEIISSSEYSSSSEQTSISNKSFEISANTIPDRPSSSGCIMRINKNKETIERPSTADHFKTPKNLTNYGPISGNIITTVRRQRAAKKSAWAGSADSSESASPLSSLDSMAKQFPITIPQQTHIELELGVVGLLPMPNINNSTDQDDTFKLLSAARKWRQRCQQNRELIKREEK